MLLFRILLFVPIFLLLDDRPLWASEGESQVVREYFPAYNGLKVKKIEISGLRRSRERIVRWILGVREGESFDARTWQLGIEYLYKTESLYDLHTEIQKEGDSINILLSLQDKWTLFPYFDFRGGGGALSLSAGIFDSNFLGTFTNAYVGGGYFNREYSYEFGLSQKWFLQTNYSLSLELFDRDFPVTLQDGQGRSLSSFTWSRNRRFLSIGRQNGESLYWQLGIESYRDRLRVENGRTISFLYPGKSQVRISPGIKIGKVTHSEYLEEGEEAVFSAASANPLNSNLEYHAFMASWKQVFFLPDTKNIAYFFSLNAMSSSPLAYQNRLGGFDSVRGFGLNRVISLDTARANLEYRSTLLKWKIPFFDIDRVILQSCAFLDAGYGWNVAQIDPVTGKNTQNESAILYSAGAGLRAIFVHFANAIARLDFARAIRPDEGFNISFGVGQFF